MAQSMFANPKNVKIQGGQFTIYGDSPLHKYIAHDAFHDSAEQYDSLRYHSLNAREAVLTNIMGWLEDPVVETRILWTHGSPGVGKSAIARMIAEMCIQAGKSVASFFFSRATPGRDSAEKLLPSLAYQLSRSIPEIRDNLARVLGEDPLLPSRNINFQAQNLIIKPLNEYDLMTAPGLEDRARVVILDGLDECRTEDQRNILEMLSKIGTDPSQSLHPFFLVFSRTESHITASFTKEPLQSLTSFIALDDSFTRHFSELDTLYDHLFSSIIHVKEVLQILALLLLCKSFPSRTSVIDEFLSFIPGSTATILSGLHSVLLVASPTDSELNGKVKITDASFSDFLLDRKRSGKYFINATEGRSTITRRLLQILLTEGCSKVLKDACQATLPDVLEDLYDINLPRFVVPMSPADLDSIRLQDWEFVAKFFLWMEHQTHPNRTRNLFQHHLPAIDKWMRGLIDRLRPRSLVTEVKSITFLSLPEVESGRVARGRSQEVDVLLIIAELKPGEVHSRPARTELSFHMYTLRSTPFDILLRKFIAAHSPGAGYLLNGEKCARLARTLWMYVLPYKVRKSLMDKRFGPPYPAPLTFHSFNGMKTPSEEELSLLLLPKILPQVPEAGTDSTLLEFLKIVQDHPLLKYFHPTNELYWLHKEVSAAVELYLTPDLFKQLKETSEPEPKKHSSRKSKD